MNYIKEMRKLIGKRPLMLVGTSVIVIRNDEILLQKRADNGLWSYPGGIMEFGEIPEESAKRELLEETGLIAKRLDLYGVFSGERRHFKYPNGDEVYITDIVYECSDFYNSNKGFDNEVIELRWYKFNDIPRNLDNATEDIIIKYLSDSNKEL